MAVAVSTLVQSAVVKNNSTDYATASFTPADGCLLVAFTSAVDTNGPLGADWTISGGSLVWTQRVFAEVVGDFRAQAVCWTAPVTTGPSMTVTFGTGANAIINPSWAVVQVTGHDTTTPTGVTAGECSTTTDGALTVTLSGAPASSSLVLAYLGIDQRNNGSVATVTPGTGWTELGEGGSPPLESFSQTQYRTGSASTSVAWIDVTAGDAGAWSTVAVAVELKEAVAAAYVRPNVNVSRQAAHRAARW